MKNLNLLFIEGNRTKIDEKNVASSYSKIDAHGYIKTMPIEYFPMNEVKDKLGNRNLYKCTLVPKNGNKKLSASNFKVEKQEVPVKDYDQYDGVCADGQHRYLACMLPELENVEVEYVSVTLPSIMSVMTYIALRNNGKKWNNNDFMGSHMKTGNEFVDQILEKHKSGYESSFLFGIFSFGTGNLTADHVKSLQQGFKTIKDYKSVVINHDTLEKGNKVLEALETNSFLTNDRFNGRFGTGLKLFYKDECQGDLEKVIATINHIDKEVWNNYFVTDNGKSMEAKGYKEALQCTLDEITAPNTEEAESYDETEQVGLVDANTAEPDNNTFSEVLDENKVSVGTSLDETQTVDSNKQTAVSTEESSVVSGGTPPVDNNNDTDSNQDSPA